MRQIRDVLRLWPKRVIPQEEDTPIAKKRKSRKSLAVIFVALAFLSARVSFVTYASFTSGQATITGITLSTAASFPGDVVINEVMWMGSSGNDNDEWIELRNTTGNPIDLAGWKIDGAGSESSSITLSGTIPTDGYFLLGNFTSGASAINDSITVDQVEPSVSLLNTGEQLTLKSAIGVTIDQTPSGAWAAGDHTLPIEKSMERNNDPITGWHTCINDACNDTTYWDVEGNNYGTPKAANLSENDPTPEITSTPSPTPTTEPEPSLNPLPTSSPDVSPTPTPSSTPETSPTPTPTPTTEPSSTPVPSTTPTPSLSPEPSPEVSPTPTPEPSNTPTPTPLPEEGDNINE